MIVVYISSLFSVEDSKVMHVGNASEVNSIRRLINEPKNPDSPKFVTECMGLFRAILENMAHT